jgi:hypothetical protein
MENSKAENGFQIIRKRNVEKETKISMKMAEYIASNCNHCPLYRSELCTDMCMPPAILEDKEAACMDWIYLYFVQKVK